MIDLPKDFADALKHAGLAAFFADCTNAHRNEYLKWIAGAKRPETRKARIGKAIKMLSEKRAEEDERAKSYTPTALGNGNVGRIRCGLQLCTLYSAPRQPEGNLNPGQECG